jgi:hypothetical protein
LQHLDNDGALMSTVVRSAGPGWSVVNYSAQKLVRRHTTGKVSIWHLTWAGTTWTTTEIPAMTDWNIVNYWGQYFRPVPAGGPEPMGSSETYCRILWRHRNGTISIWDVDHMCQQKSYKEWGLNTVWMPVHSQFNRILWTHPDRRISLWNIHNQTFIGDYVEHGPFDGWQVVNFSSSETTAFNLLWKHDDGRVSLWKMDSTGTQSSYKEYGPFPGWRVINQEGDRLLWQHENGTISLWFLNGDLTQHHYIERAPEPGWVALRYSKWMYGTAE